MKNSKKPKKYYRVKFQDPTDKKYFEIVAASVSPSEFMGLVRLSGLQFEDIHSYIIRPHEDAARQKFSATDILHIPYHSIIYIEEFVQDPAELTCLPLGQASDSNEEKTIDIDHNQFNNQAKN